MSKLNDLYGKTVALQTEIARVMSAYEAAVHAYHQIESSTPGQPVNLSGIGMSIHLGDVELPLPLPTDVNALAMHLESVVNFCVFELTRLWAEVQAVAADATMHCEVTKNKIEASAAAPVGQSNVAAWPGSITQPQAQQPQAPQPPAMPPSRMPPPAHVLAGGQPVGLGAPPFKTAPV